MANLEKCSGCGTEFAPFDGPIHKYLISTPACWAAFGKVLAAEYSDVALWQTHRLSVDTYAVQHPGDGSRKAIQSVGLHLARLLVQIEAPRPPDETNDVMLRLGQHKSQLPDLPPPDTYAMTVKQVAAVAGTSKHAEMVKRWAEATWADWSHQHDFIREWVASVSPDLLG